LCGDGRIRPSPERSEGRCAARAERALLSGPLMLALLLLSPKSAILTVAIPHYFVIPTGAGPPATAERRNLLFADAPTTLHRASN
jgi:hypothetical protein